MYNVSNEFKQNVKKTGRMKDTQVIYDNKTVKPEMCVLDFKSSLFKTIMQSVDIEIKDNENLIDKEVTIKNGFKVNDKFEYINYGVFKITECEEDATRKKIKAKGYDKMINFMIPFALSDFIFTPTTTLLEFLKAICLKCKVELYSENFLNANLIIDKDYYTVLKASFRDVLEQIAQVTCTTIFIKENKLYLSKINVTNEILSSDVLIKPKLKSKFGAINLLTLGRGDVEDNVYFPQKLPLVVCDIRFDENEIIDKRREKVIEGMFNQIKDIEYYPFEVNTLGLGYFEPCDLITIKDIKSNQYNVLILNRKLVLTSGIKEEISSDIPKQTTTKYQYATSTEKKFLKVERIANKQEGIITDVVQTQVEQSSKLTKYEQDINAFNFNLQEAGGLNLIKNSTLRLGLDKNVTTTGTVTIEQYKDILDNTKSKSAIKINKGSVQFERIKIQQGQDYTFSCIFYKKELANIVIKLISDQEYIYTLNMQNDTFEEFEATIKSNVDYIDIRIECDNNYAVVADCMFNKGSKLGYQAYAGEVVGNGFKIDIEGLELNSTATNTNFIANTTEVKIVNKDTGKGVYFGEETSVNKLKTEEFTMGKIRFTKLDNGNLMITRDD